MIIYLSIYLDPKAKLEKFKSLQTQGIYFNDNLIQNKSYRNPHIYTKLVQFVEVQETGTNFNPKIWNPLGFPPEAYADALRTSIHPSTFFFSFFTSL